MLMQSIAHCGVSNGAEIVPVQFDPQCDFLGVLGRTILMPCASRVRVANHWWSDRLTDRKLNVVVICNIAAETDCPVSSGDEQLCRRVSAAFIQIGERRRSAGLGKRHGGG
jgi:hypothetical protein